MFRVSYGSKYGNISAEHNGIQYHSKKEAAYAAELDLRIKAGDIKSWKRQVCIGIKINKCHICNYYIDFVVTHNDGVKEYIEVKGFETDVWKLKWKMFEALYSKRKNTKLTIIK